MRNLPLVAYRLTHAERTACQAEADARGITLNELAKRALLRELERVNTGVNTGARDLEFVPDDAPVGDEG